MTPEESALLGSILLRKNALGVALEHVSPEDFSSEAGKVLFAAMEEVGQRTDTLDPIVLRTHCGDALEPYGGRAWLYSLPQMCPFPTNTREYARQVREASIDRSARRAVADAQGSGSDYVAAVQEALYRIERKDVTGVDMASTFKSMLEPKEHKPGLSYPWEQIQTATRGMREGWLCVLAGEPGHGKSCAALMVSQVAVNAGKRVCYVSLEMSAEEIGVRFAQRIGLSSGRYWSGEMTEDDTDAISYLLNDEHWHNLSVERVDRMGQIPSIARRQKSNLLVVDHLQLLAGERSEDISKVTRALKLLAGQLEIPVLLLSQLNRGEREEDNRIPRLKRLRGSGSIEQDADTVLFVWRKRDENEQLTDEAALSVAKSRHGRTVTLRARFDGVRQEFRVVTSEV